MYTCISSITTNTYFTGRIVIQPNILMRASVRESVKLLRDKTVRSFAQNVSRRGWRSRHFARRSCELSRWNTRLGGAGGDVA